MNPTIEISNDTDRNEVNNNCEKLSWINRIININNLSYPDSFLDSEYKTVFNVPGLNVVLYGHQKTIVRAMIDLENSKRLDLCSSKNNITYNAEVNAGILSEKVGSGKTFDILATILLNPIPAKSGEIHIIRCKENKINTPFMYRKSFKYTLTPTLIFVGSSVIKQWISSISNYTNLKTFIVYGIKEFENLVNMITDKTINNFDIVLIKNGTIARIVLPKGLSPPMNFCNSTPHMYSLLSVIKGICWPRVVIDDFDVIKLRSESLTINANFTWYVSSTRKSMTTDSKNSEIATCFRSLSQFLKYGNYKVGNITNNKFLYKSCNIRNSNEFIAETNTLPTPRFFAYKFKNPNAKLIHIINSLSHEMKEVIEMINADAIETAAEHLGIKVTTTAGIFEKLLGDQYQEVIFLTKIIKFIDEQTNNLLTRDTWQPNNGNYGIRQLEKFEPITIKYPKINEFLSNQHIKYSERKNDSMVTLNRIKDHITDGDCPICFSELKNECDGKVIIFKCCSVIICEGCTFGSVFKKKHAAICANCRALVDLKDLIYINNEINLDKIIKDMEAGNIEKDDAENCSKKITNFSIKPKKNYSKYDCIVDIIREADIPIKVEVNVDIPVIMTGPVQLPVANTKKILVFANFDETLKKIQNKFEEEKINYEQLGGTHKQISEIIDRFQNTNTNNVLLINSIKHCAGINLQMATDLVFSHLISDKDIEGQVAGRIMRLGRTTEPNFHYMLFDNEYENKLSNGQMWIK